MAASRTRAISEKTNLSLEDRLTVHFDKNKCRVCKDPITIQIFKGTELCSDNCRKIDEREGDGDSNRRSN